MNDPLQLARPELAALPPYGRTEVEASVRLDANEVPWRPVGDRSRAGLNRYPPLRATALERRLADLYRVAPGRVVAGRGSDEAIDLLVRAFCNPGRDAVLVMPPTFGMYALAATIQGARVVEAPRERAAGFAVDLDAVAAKLEGVKLLFVADPDNPTGRRATRQEIAALAELTAGRALLVVDEAYAEFADGTSAIERLDDWPHLVVLRTLSKAHALAGVRCGAAIARSPVADLLARIQPPYALGRPSIDAVLEQTAPRALAATRRRIAALVAERERLVAELACVGAVAEVFPSAANFLLIACRDVAAARRALADARIATRSFDEPVIADCLRLTVGTRDQNRRLIGALERA